MRKFLLISGILIASSFASNSVTAQVTQQWVSRYNSNEVYTNIVMDMEVDKMGNVYILGYNDSIFTIKYNSSGASEWIRKYKGPSQYADRASDMVIDESGNIYVTGMSNTNNQNPFQPTAVVIKYSHGGDELWTKRFLNSDSIECIGKYVLQADSGNIYITAECRRLGLSKDITILKISPDGDIMWKKYYSTSQHDAITFATMDRLNNLYISGCCGSQANTSVKLKYNSNGGLELQIEDTLGAIKLLVDNEFYINIAGTYTSPITRQDILVSKYDSAGNNLWISTYHHDSFLNNDIYRDFTIDEIGNSYVTGVSADGMELAWDIVTIKYNQFGDSVWVQRYDSIYNSNDDPSSIAVDNYGNVYVTGSTNFNFLANSYITICYDSTGNQKFALFYNNNLPFHNHEAKIIKTDTAGNFYVTGISQNGNAQNEIATIKYNIVTSIHNLLNEIPESSRMYQNYPNPFNPATRIKFDIAKSGNVKLTIFDLLGREVSTLVNENLIPGTYQVSFDGSNFSSGVYFYKLSADGFAEMKRMIMVK